MKEIETIWIVGTLLTFFAAWIVWKKWREPGAAIALIVASPFPCPPGLPC